MTKLFKKSLLSGLALTGAISVLALASCGTTNSKFDQAKDKKLKFALTITDAGVKKALGDILEKYNKEKSAESGMTWEVLNVAGSYSGLDSVMNKALPVKDEKALFNVALNYPSALAIANKFDMGLPIDKETIDLSTIFDSQFLEINNNITGSEKGIQWTIPVAKSTEMLSLNLPMLAYVLEKAESDGLTKKDEANEESKKIYDKIKKEGVQDKEFIEKVFGTYKSDENGLKNYVFSLDIFKHYDTLIDFINRVSVAFPKFKDREGKEKDQVGKALLGLDSASNAFYTSAFASVGADYSKFLFSLTSDRSAMDFNTVLNSPDSIQYKTLKKVYENFEKTLRTKQLFVKSESTYSSNYSKFHQLMVSIGSTAGYNYNFISGGAKVYEATKKNNEKIEKILESDVYKIIKPTTDSGNDVLAIILSGRYKNKIYKSTYSGKMGSYDIKSANAEMDAKLGDLVSKATSADEVLAYGTKSIEAKGEELLGKLGNTEKSIEVYFFAKDKFAEAENKANKSLQESELLVLPAPVKFSSSDPKEISTLQGPSLLAMHANDEENAETQKFLKWFLTETKDWEIGSGNNKKSFSGTAAEFFATVGNYIFPSKKYVSELSSKKFNNAVKIAADNVKKIAEKTLAPMEDPVESRSSLFRKAVQDGMKTMENRSGQVGEAKVSFAEFLSELKKTMHTAQ